MKILLKSAMVAGLMLGAAQPAIAQSSGTVVQGVGYANLDAVVVNSTAYQTAEQQRQTTYKAQFDAAEAKRNQLNAQLQPLADKFNKDRAAANPNQQALTQQMQQIQQIQQRGQQELEGIMQPVALSRAYVTEQVSEKLPDAVKTVIERRKISLLLSPDNILHADAAYNLNQAILDELNKMIPSAQLVPPAGWEPREVREARAQQQGAQAPATTPAGSQPQGR